MNTLKILESTSLVKATKKTLKMYIHLFILPKACIIGGNIIKNSHEKYDSEKTEYFLIFFQIFFAVI